MTDVQKWIARYGITDEPGLVGEEDLQEIEELKSINEQEVV